MTARKVFTKIANIITGCQALKVDRPKFNLLLRYRTRYESAAMRSWKTAEEWACKSVMKEKASPAGGARIMRSMRAHLTK